MIGWWSHTRNIQTAGVRIRAHLVINALRERKLPVGWVDGRSEVNYDTVILHKHYDDAAYAQVLKWKAAGTRVIFDMCDNHFYNPQRLPEWVQRGNQLRRMLEVADQVVASTQALSEALTEECPCIGHIEVIGDALDDLSVIPIPLLDRLKLPLRTRFVFSGVGSLRKCGHTALLWFGNHGSPYAEGGMLDLAPLRAGLQSLHSKYPLLLTIVSNSREKFDQNFSSWGIPCFYLPWHPLSFAKIAVTHDIAIIPIQSNGFTRCKTDNRLVTSLAQGLAVVANPISSYLPYAQVARIGDITDGLRDYLAKPDVRKQESVDGKKLVESTRNIRHVADQWQALLLDH